jgi:hypothetical protein
VCRACRRCRANGLFWEGERVDGRKVSNICSYLLGTAM